MSTSTRRSSLSLQTTESCGIGTFRESFPSFTWTSSSTGSSARKLFAMSPCQACPSEKSWKLLWIYHPARVSWRKIWRTSKTWNPQLQVLQASMHLQPRPPQRPQRALPQRSPKRARRTRTKARARRRAGTVTAIAISSERGNGKGKRMTRRTGAAGRIGMHLRLVTRGGNATEIGTETETETEVVTSLLPGKRKRTRSEQPSCETPDHRLQWSVCWNLTALDSSA
mmetsp:Transcript_5855/g.8315  ORF Transcript_5855/g.8315 Transcript_5855/m.8315 type:complete len:226 (-) Transcript_5855:51-728(-)